MFYFLIRRTVQLLIVLLAIVGGSLLVMHWAAPAFQAEEGDAEQALSAAVVASLGRLGQQSGPRYISFDGRDPLPASMIALRAALPGLEIQPLSLRATRNDRCDTSGDGAIVTIGACREDNFTAVELVARPLWRTALIRERTAACSAQRMLFRFPSAWRSVEYQWVCA
ncbi:hypothetical protein [Rugamonas rubra]|uniref:hypothetical protein n=1 Tax=Rugamonas rubra TaxID=758825 RepID=UPI001113344B|nr:hypothetical protein [Rugamonas rubra]